MKKLIIIASIIFLTVNIVSADQIVLTNSSFADLLVKVLGVELPAGTENLAEEEYYEVLSNLLATIGIAYFANNPKGEEVSYAGFVEVLYAVVGGEEVNSELKHKYLIETCNIPMWDNLDDSITYQEAIDLLNNPSCSTLLAEAYSPPSETTRSVGGNVGPHVMSEGSVSGI